MFILESPPNEKKKKCRLKLEVFATQFTERIWRSKLHGQHHVKTSQVKMNTMKKKTTQKPHKNYYFWKVLKKYKNMRFNQGIYRYLTTYVCTNVYLFNEKNKEELQGEKKQCRSRDFCQNNVLPSDEKITKRRHVWPNQGISASAKVCPSKETQLCLKQLTYISTHPY